MRSLPLFIHTLHMALLAVAILPSCSSVEEQPDPTYTSEPAPPKGGSDDCVVDDQQPLRWECLKQ